MSYRTDSAEKATVAEEDDEQRDGEVHDEHVDDKRGVVDLRFGSVVIYSTGALHSLWNIPAHSHMTPDLQSGHQYQFMSSLSCH